jgi:hypothetical protein
MWLKKTAKINNNIFTIDEKEENFYNSNTPFISETNESTIVLYYGTIEVPRVYHTGPLFVVGYLDPSGRFLVEDKLVEMFKWNPYTIVQPKENKNTRVYYVHLKLV